MTGYRDSAKPEDTWRLSIHIVMVSGTTHDIVHGGLPENNAKIMLREFEDLSMGFHNNERRPERPMHDRMININHASKGEPHWISTRKIESIKFTLVNEREESEAITRDLQERRAAAQARLDRIKPPDPVDPPAQKTGWFGFR